MRSTITIDEAASILRCSRRTVYRLIKVGKLRAEDVEARYWAGTQLEVWAGDAERLAKARAARAARARKRKIPPGAQHGTDVRGMDRA